MTSKEALNKLVNYIGELGGGETQEWEDVILQDLDALDLIKNALKKTYHKPELKPLDDMSFDKRVSYIVEYERQRLEYEEMQAFTTWIIENINKEKVKEWLVNG